MARPLRTHIPHAFYHVLARGNERRAIFRDARDYRRFLDLLGKTAARFRVEVWSYVLMGNHFHLVLRPGKVSLSRAMQWLGVAYSVWHNRRHKRSGHLFQGRFKAFAVNEQDYLERLICYIHRNPIRARIAERLAEYPWSSYAALGYGRPCPEWLARKEALALFGGRGETFRRRVQAYSEESGRLWEDLKHGMFLGSEDGWSRLWRRARPAAHREVPEGRLAAPGEDVGAAVARWSRVLGISRKEQAELLRPVRGRERPLRDALIHAVWSEGKFGLSEIGRAFGVGYTSIVNARQRGEAYLSRNRQLRRRLEAASNDK